MHSGHTTPLPCRKLRGHRLHGHYPIQALCLWTGEKVDSNHTIHKHEKCAGREGFEKGVEGRTGMQPESQEGAPFFHASAMGDQREPPFPFVFIAHLSLGPGLKGAAR